MLLLAIPQEYRSSSRLAGNRDDLRTTSPYFCPRVLRLAGRKLIDAAELQGSLIQVEEDLEARRLLHTPVDFLRVLERSLELSARYTQKLLCRSLDVLHVAAALELRANRFISADDRQLALASTVGIATVDIKKRR